jgi:hypothetical protein
MRLCVVITKRFIMAVVYSEAWFLENVSYNTQRPPYCQQQYVKVYSHPQ